MYREEMYRNGTVVLYKNGKGREYNISDIDTAINEVIIDYRRHYPIREDKNMILRIPKALFLLFCNTYQPAPYSDIYMFTRQCKQSLNDMCKGLKYMGIDLEISHDEFIRAFHRDMGETKVFEKEVKFKLV